MIRSGAQETFGVVITGTHLAGKSTLLDAVEDGKLVDLGFGVQSNLTDGTQIPPYYGAGVSEMVSS